MLDQREETGRWSWAVFGSSSSLEASAVSRMSAIVGMFTSTSSPRSYLLQLAQASDDGHEHRFLGFLPEVPVDALIGLASLWCCP